MDEFTSVESYLRYRKYSDGLSNGEKANFRRKCRKKCNTIQNNYTYPYAIIYLKENNPRIFDVIYKDVILSVIVS